jgi:hypothetical protein
MPNYDFSSLYAKYPTIIEDMPETFTSHQFILELARQYQNQYIEALYHYRNHAHRGVPAPFMMVHGILAQNLLRYPQLIEQVRKDADSKDIFGKDDWCSEWKKVG